MGLGWSFCRKIMENPPVNLVTAVAEWVQSDNHISQGRCIVCGAKPDTHTGDCFIPQVDQLLRDNNATD